MSSQNYEYTPIPVQHYATPVSRRGLESVIEVTQIKFSPAEIKRQVQNEDRAYINEVLETVQPGRKGQMCAGKSEFFFAEAGDTARMKVRKEKVAKALCARCPVIKDCLEESISEEGIEGIWGGLTAFERRKLIKRRNY